MRQTSGYAVVRMPTGLVAAYDESMRSHKATELFQQLCEKLKPLPRSAYRGTSRFPLMPFPSTDPLFVRSRSPDVTCAINKWFLFPSAEAAMEFRSWYRTQYWAETESRPDEFRIIQVNKPRRLSRRGEEDTAESTP